MPDAPTWSVMIPVYNRTDHLEQCLRSVLAAGLPAEAMQIAVVDDSTTNAEVEAQVRRIAGARAEYHRNAQNLGMAGNWNRCITLARGDLVHILHDDDYVSPRFYDRMGALAAQFSSASIYFSRVLQVDSGGSTTWVSPRLEAYESCSRDPASLLYRCDVRFPGVVVRREAYKRTGGFRTDLRMTLDWDMWVRLITDGGAASIDEPLAFYRLHSDNATSRYFRDGTYFTEMLQMREIFGGIHGFDPGKYAAVLEVEMRNYLTVCRERGDSDALRENLRVWRQFVPAHRRLRYAVRRSAEALVRALRV